MCSLVSYNAISAAHAALRPWRDWLDVYFGGRDSLVVERGQAGLAAEILHRLLSIHRGLQDTLRFCYRPERRRRDEISSMYAIKIKNMYNQLYDSLKAEVAGVLSLFHLVKIQKAGRWAEDFCMALPLINGFSVHQRIFAVGARRSQIHLGLSGHCGCVLFREGEDWTDLQVLLSKPEKAWGCSNSMSVVRLLLFDSSISVTTASSLILWTVSCVLPSPL